MTKALDTYCSSPKWVGRAHCERCHVRRLMLFSKLPEEVFDTLLQPIDNYIFPAGSVIYSMDDPKKFVYSIRRGMVKLVQVAKDGSYRIVRLLGAGATIGLELLDGSGNYHHTAIAIDEVDLCKIPVPTIKRIESKYPVLYQRVGDLLQAQLDLADQWIVTLGAGKAKQRVAQLLLILNKYFTNKHDEFILLNREDMAAMIGIVTETVSRMIAEFKREKLLYKTEDKLYKCDVAGLQKIIGYK